MTEKSSLFGYRGTQNENTVFDLCILNNLPNKVEGENNSCDMPDMKVDSTDFFHNGVLINYKGEKVKYERIRRI